jgi:hypothetical protein
LLVTVPEGDNLDAVKKRWLTPALRCARRPSSGATRPAIRLPRKPEPRS